MQKLKLQLSSEKETSIQKYVTFHLGLLKRKFNSNGLNENYVFNSDKKHFVIYMENGQTLRFTGDKDIKYAYVASSGEVMTMVMLISGGVNYQIEKPFMILKNTEHSYLVCGINDTSSGVIYRTQLKVFIDKKNEC